MTRICEEFIEEITSGSGNASSALLQHLASCSACRETFSSLKQLKDTRKPMSGKEAVAIAGILNAVKTGAASTAVSSPAATGGALLLKSLVVAICVLSVAGALFMQARSSDCKVEEPVSGITTAIETPTEKAVIPGVDENKDLADNVGVNSTSTGAIPAVELVASDTLTDNSQEDSNNGEAQTMSVSPDEEDIKPH